MNAIGRDASYITKTFNHRLIQFHLTKLQNGINQALPVFPAIKTGFVYYPALVFSWSLITSGTR